MRVRGKGPTNPAICFIGEAPGWQEDRAGECFVGKTGQELDRLLDCYGLPSRTDCYLTNVYKEYRGADYVYNAADLAADEPELLAELQRTQPRLIVPLGRHATRWLLGDVDMDGVHSIPYEIGICYACASNGSKVLVAGSQDKRLLDLDRVCQQSGLWLANIPSSKLASPSSRVYTDSRDDPHRGGSRSHMPERKMCPAGSFGDSYQGREQSTSQACSESLSLRASTDRREHIYLSDEQSSPLSDVRQTAGAREVCPSCGDALAKIVCFSIFHPAASFHSPELATYVVYGFSQLAKYLEGGIEPRILHDDPYPEPQYEEITDVSSLQSRLCGLPQGAPLAIDTEGYPHAPWSVQFASEPGTGYLIRANRGELLRQFGEYLARSRPTLIYHSALHDLSMMRVLGLPTDLPFEDTMVMAYLLQLEPQGLKALATRHANMAMQSYDEVMGDAGQLLAQEYLADLWDIETFYWQERNQAEFDRRKTEIWTDKKGKVQSGRRITKVPELAKTSLHKATQRALQSKNARKLWDNQTSDIEVAAYRQLGSMPEATLDLVDPAMAVHYGCRDADATVRVRPQLRRRVDDLGLGPVYQLELGTYPLIARMQFVGIRPDLDHFAALSTRLHDEIATIHTRLVGFTGSATFNANSGDQVADYLFDELGLESLKNTRSGRGSTNDKILEALERAYPELPVIADIRQYREVYKLKHTFVDRLPDFVHRWPFDGRVHATFRTTRVVTGRLAASDPNLLAMPKHGKFAKDFRRGWVPEPGHVFGSWDLSQAELRGAAHLSQDPVMLAIYRGEKRNPDGSMIDLHAVLGERIFGIPAQQQDESLHRLPMKEINFGYWMGQTAKGLVISLAKVGMRLSEDDAQRWLDEADALYVGAKPYKAAMIEHARKYGFVRCLSGRIRYIGGIRSTDARIREAAEREAFATPVQESAQLIAKHAETVLYNEILVPLWRQGRYIEPLLFIHDDLFLEFENEDLARDVHPMMVHAMTQSYTGLSVPIETEGTWGYSWCKAPKKGAEPGDMVKF